MCVLYGGIKYSQGFDREIIINSQSKHFYILMTSYMHDNDYTYAGLCLNNMLEVCTNEKRQKIAEEDIFSKIENVVKDIEETKSTFYSFHETKPYINMSGLFPIIIKKFQKKRLSLGKFYTFPEELKPFLETRVIDLDPILEILINNPEVKLSTVQKKPDINNLGNIETSIIRIIQFFKEFNPSGSLVPALNIAGNRKNRYRL